MSDAFVSAEVERALAPFDGLFDDEERAYLREALAAELAEDAELAALLATAHPSSVDTSGERLRPWLGLDEDAAAATAG